MLALALWACAQQHAAEDPSAWYDTGVARPVDEPIAFTDEPYDFDGGIGALKTDVFPVADYTVAFAPGDGWEDGVSCEQTEDPALPERITGVVTIDPRYYFKTSGCDKDDEKFYGSFFLQDANDGVFVLGDSKVAHWRAGDTVTIDVLAAKTTYDLDMVYAWKLVSVDRQERAISYRTALQPLGPDDQDVVVRVTGTVKAAPDAFGAFQVESDAGTTFDVAMDAELHRRGVTVEPGEQVQVTGPVLYSYSVYSIVVMSTGQLVELDAAPN